MARALFLLFAIAALLPADTKWVEYRRAPFFVTTTGSQKEARIVANELEQLRNALDRELAVTNLQLSFPLRIIVADLPPMYPRLGRDAYMMVVNRKEGLTPALRAEVTRLLLDRNMKRIPPAMEKALIAVFATLDVDKTIVTLGRPIAALTADPNYARMHLLLTSPLYAGHTRVFLNNMGQGSDLDVAFRNAYGKTQAEVDAEVKAYLQNPKWFRHQIVAAPIDPERDFTAYTIRPPADALISIDLELAAGRIQQAFDRYQPLAEDTVADPVAIDGAAIAACLLQRDKDCAFFAGRASDANSKNARVPYLLGLSIKDQRDSWTQIRRACDLNPQWPEAFIALAERENDPARRLKALHTAATLALRNDSYWQQLAEAYEAQSMFPEAVKAWGQARLSAETDEQRAHLESIRKASDQQRALAAQQAEKDRRAAAARELDRVREENMARIRMAEARAREDMAKRAGNKPSTAPVVAWSDLYGKEERLTGHLARVECTKNQRRLFIDTKDGQITLNVPDVGNLALVTHTEQTPELICGPATPPISVIVTYRHEINSKARTIGVATTLEFLAPPPATAEQKTPETRQELKPQP